MTHEERVAWEARHREGAPGTPEPSLLELMPLLPRGLVLDIGAGTGRHALVLARAGFRVVAVDYAVTAARVLQEAAAADGLPIMPLIADFDHGLPFRPGVFDAVVNINFLDRALVPRLKEALQVGGMLLFDTFLEDQAALGHPRDPRFLLRHYELREMLTGMELLHYREGMTVYSLEKRAWRATALARRI